MLWPVSTAGGMVAAMMNVAGPAFEELDYQQTPMGELILQRRTILALNNAEAYEVRLNNEYLMSSLFHEAEEVMSDLALAELSGDGWEVVVGGLGLGYTAASALKYPRVGRLIVVEALEPVIDWHRRGLVPNGKQLSEDSRCVFLHADFFALARGEGFAPGSPHHRFDAVLLDIDHAPDFLLNPAHADFYTEAGLQRLKNLLKPGGVFALWSNDPVDPGFLGRLQAVFDRAEGHLVPFENPLIQSTSSNSVYIACRNK